MNNKDFDVSTVIGFKSKEKFYAIDFILTK
jgi:hypothetical protein